MNRMKITDLTVTLFKWPIEPWNTGTMRFGGNSLNNVANLHVTMAVPNCDYYEVFPADGANKYGLVNDIEVDGKGVVYVLTGPGLGYEIDWDLVKRDTVEVLR